MQTTEELISKTLSWSGRIVFPDCAAGLAVRQVTTTGQIKAHDPCVWWQERSVHGKVGRTAGVWLNVDTPLLVQV
eukprot:5438019-Amphidinium_carterae.1